MLKFRFPILMTISITIITTAGILFAAVLITLIITIAFFTIGILNIYTSLLL